MRDLAVFLVVILITSLALGCGTTPDGTSSGSEKSSSRGRTKTVDGLVKTEIDMPGVLFLREDHGIGSYDAFLVPRASITYKRRSKHLDPELEEEFTATLEQSLIDLAEAADVPVVRSPGACVMLVGVALVNVEVARSTSSGALAQMTAVMEFRDSMSGQPLLRYATQNLLKRQGPGTQSRQLQRAFDEVMVDMDIGRAMTVAGLGDNQIRPGCNGTLAKRGRAAAAAADVAAP